MRNIFLIGYMGTGKSTVASYLSEQHGFTLLEMDQVIEEREGMSISDIFSKYGESYFREMETNLLVELQTAEGYVVSCGGGVALRKENVEEMRKSGTIILLSANPETILERVKDDENRPLLKGKKTIECIREMMESRRIRYENAADIVIQTDDKLVKTICDELLYQLKQIGE